jgi:hypothetical protein
MIQQGGRQILPQASKQSNAQHHTAIRAGEADARLMPTRGETG